MRKMTKESEAKNSLRKGGFFKKLKSNGESQLQELVEDMVGIVQSLSRLEHQAAEFGANLSSFGHQLHTVADSQSRLQEEVRRELTSERRAFALRLIFEPIAGALDSLELIRKGLDPTASPEVFRQLSSAIAVVANLVQSLGFARFEPAIGESFDGNRMECFGYAEGNPGEVVGVLQPGYMAAGLVARPAGVLLADGRIPEPLPGR